IEKVEEEFAAEMEEIRDGHAFILVGLPGSEQIWDPWGNIAFLDTPINRKNLLKCWIGKLGKDGIFYNELEPFDPSQHEFIIIEDHSLANLKLFRELAARVCPAPPEPEAS